MVRFIKVEENDVVELADLAFEIWHEYWVRILSLAQIDYMVEKFQSEKAILNQMKSENYIYFFINVENMNIGYFGISLKEDYLFLSKLYIKEDFRHSGFGTKAFEFIKEFALDKHYKRIILTVNKYNRNSIEAYLKWGFQSIDAVETQIGEGFIMDDYIMEYRFTPQQLKDKEEEEKEEADSSMEKFI